MTRSCALVWLISVACPSVFAEVPPTIGEVIPHDPRIAEVLDGDAKIEVIATGFKWSEGPCWVPKEDGYLLFSDVPANSIYRWTQVDGISLFLKPSGFTGRTKDAWNGGSNGLLLNRRGEIVCFEHGDRRVSCITRGGGKITLADRYDGKRLNSPNDGVFDRYGNLYFTDPPYGLREGLADDLAELDFSGLYRLAPDGDLTLLSKEMTFPNGVGLSPDGKTLYVSQCDPNAAIWRAFPVNDDGTVGNPHLFADATSEWGQLPGLVDGLTIDVDGRVWATSPGGVTIFLPDGTTLGRIGVGEKISNCTFGGAGNSILYLTADMHVCRITTKTSGYRPFAPAGQN